MKLRSLLAAGGLALLISTPALADITVLSGNTPGALDPVTLDGGALDFVVNGVAGPDNIPVTFTGAENLKVQGQRIKAATGTFDFLLFTLTDPTRAFTAAEFNLKSAASGPVSIFAYDQFGNAFGGSFALNSAGSNFFNLAATSGQVIRSVVITSTAALNDVRQIRLGGFTSVGLVPEPSTWGMMIAGFGGLGCVLRTRRRRQEAA